MKTCGIEIDKDTIRFVLLDNSNDEIKIIEQKENFFTLRDTQTAQGLKNFRDVVYSFIDNQAPDKIAIISRLATGRNASHGISFKIEAVLQLYLTKSIELVSSKTINTFVKKHPHDMTTKYNNQIESLNLAYYLIKI
jgi:Protein of unknown function (DUF3010)